MPAQTQNRQTSAHPADEFEESSAANGTASKGRKANRGISFIKVFLIIIACVFSLLAGNILHFNSTLFLEHREEEGYLLPEEYILVDSDTGEPGQNVRTIGLHSMHTWHGNGMRTARGIGEGSSWQDVVDAYGDVYAHTISYQPGFTGEYDYSKDVRIDGPIKLSDFNEQYVKTGLCNPDTDRIWIRFQFWHDTINIYYTEEDAKNSKSRKSSAPWYIAPMIPDDPDRDFELTISLVPNEGVEYVSSFFF